MSCDPERQRLINEAARLINEIDQMYCDAEYWNSNTRPRLYPEAAPIDPDRGGLLDRVRTAYRKMLSREAELGNAPSVTYPPVTPSKYIALTDNRVVQSSGVRR